MFFHPKLNQMENRWLLKPQPDPETIIKLIDEVNLPSSLALILAQRGVDDFQKAKNFFRPSLENLHDPFLMKDMEKAVERIIHAVNNLENILVYGDYDVDGTTAVSLMYEFLQSIYPKVTSYIPDRYEEGYGISFQSVDFAEDNDISLIIALDCGIKAHPQIQYAKDKNIDFIVCDHHLPGETIPNAAAVLDPKREDCGYPYEFLSGCGVGFKLIQAISQTLNLPEENLNRYLDLVAVSIAADIVPITGENRILAHFGLEQINKNPRVGLKIMLNEKVHNFNISHIVFGIAPKINAAGRIKHGSFAVSLLTSRTIEEAEHFVSEINLLNNQRKELDQSITLDAMDLLDSEIEKEKFTTVVYNPEWNKGVIGIVASRLIEHYYRPTFVFTKGNDGYLVASARSVKGFDLYAAIDKNAGILEKFGGHTAAAGLTIKESNFELFKERIEETVKNTISHSQRIPTVEIDYELNFDEINDKFLRILPQMAPFGPENMTPVFLSKNLIADDVRTLGKDKEHLKMMVYQRGTHQVFPAIGFNLGHFGDKVKSNFDMVYSLEENHWNGKTTWQLSIKDISIRNNGY